VLVLFYASDRVKGLFGNIHSQISKGGLICGSSKTVETLLKNLFVHRLICLLFELSVLDVISFLLKIVMNLAAL